MKDSIRALGSQQQNAVRQDSGADSDTVQTRALDMDAAEQPCQGCGKPLLVENAWMEDGCPCNTPAGVNNLNLYRWRLLHELQQRQARMLAAAPDAQRGQWVSVKERLPEKDVLVLVYQDIWGRSLMTWNGLNWRADHLGDTYPPTHWMPLPAAPKRGG